VARSMTDAETEVMARLRAFLNEALERGSQIKDPGEVAGPGLVARGYAQGVHTGMKEAVEQVLAWLDREAG
jgi:hypothetical protein